MLWTATTRWCSDSGLGAGSVVFFKSDFAFLDFAFFPFFVFMFFKRGSSQTDHLPQSWMTFVFQSVHLKHPDDANMRSMPPCVVVDRGRVTSSPGFSFGMVTVFVLSPKVASREYDKV